MTARRAEYDVAADAERVGALKALDIFANAPEPVLELLAAGVREQHVPPGTTVIRQGRMPSHLFVVVSGSLDVSSVDEAGHPKHVAVVHEGDYLGEIGLIEGVPSTATVTAKTPCVLYAIGGADVLRAIRRSRALSDALLERIGQRLARTHGIYRPVAQRSEAGSEQVRQLAHRLLGVIGRAAQRYPDDPDLRTVLEELSRLATTEPKTGADGS
ncbi:MAG: cyclic nucleotide-binding domain-containing protein [Actinomycetota bacterium]